MSRWTDLCLGGHSQLNQGLPDKGQLHHSPDAAHQSVSDEWCWHKKPASMLALGEQTNTCKHPVYSHTNLKRMETTHTYKLKWLSRTVPTVNCRPCRPLTGMNFFLLCGSSTPFLGCSLPVRPPQTGDSRRRRSVGGV